MIPPPQSSEALLVQTTCVLSTDFQVSLTITATVGTELVVLSGQLYIWTEALTHLDVDGPEVEDQF